MRSSLFQAACVAIPKGLGGVLAVVLNGVLLSRMSPAEFGAYAVCLTLVILADGVLGSAVDMSAVKMTSARLLHDPRAAAAIEQWAVVFKLVVSVAVLGTALMVAGFLAEALFHRPSADLLLAALSVASGVLMLRSLFLHLQLKQRFVAYAGLELLAQTLRVAGVVAVLWWFTVSALSLVVAALVGTVLAVLGGMWIARVRLQWPDLQWADGREFARTVRWILATFAFSSVLARIDVLMLTHASTIEQVGLFAAAAVFAQIPELLGMYLAVVFSPKVTPANANGTLPRLMRQVQSGLLAFALAIAFVAMCALQFGGELLPSAYARSADVFVPLLAGSLAGMVAMPVTVPFVMFVRPSFILKYDLLTAPILLIAYQYAIASSGAVGAAWVSGGSRMLKAAVLQTCAWMWAQYDVRTPLGMTR
jgi:O-antigen/teichoic acid export membrane protein